MLRSLRSAWSRTCCFGAPARVRRDGERLTDGLSRLSDSGNQHVIVDPPGAPLADRTRRVLAASHRLKPSGAQRLIPSRVAGLDDVVGGKRARQTLGGAIFGEDDLALADVLLGLR